MDKKQRAAEVYRRLDKRYPEPTTALEWSDPWELLVGTVLAAQSTDKKVNLVMPEFIRRWPGPEELARAERSEIEDVIRSLGLFRNKAKSLKAAAEMLVEKFDGEVPDEMDDLVKLPGVARKTAAIVLWDAFGKNRGLAVDTHVKRLSFRLGLTKNTEQNRIEKDLMRLFPRERWGPVNHLLVNLGREICTAAKPKCPECPLADICPKEGVGK
jgi:endonuclease-3